MKAVYEQKDLATNQVPINEQPLPSAKSVEQIRRDIEQMTGRRMETRTTPKEDGQV